MFERLLVKFTRRKNIMTEDYETDLTPEQVEAARVEQFGDFADATATVNEAEKTVTIVIEKPAPSKDRLEFRTDTAKAAMMMLNDVAADLVETSKVKLKGGGAFK